MKINKYLTIAIGLGLATLTSCDMDLTPSQYVEAEDPSTSINSELTLNAMRRGIYSSYRSTFYGGMSQPSEVMLDGFNATVDFGNNYGPIHRTDASFTSSDEDVQTLWNGYYGSIKDYNIFISAAEKFAAENEDYKAEANLYISEARCFRAYSYMELVRHFAKAYNPSTASTDLGVPLVLEYNQQDKPHRATVAAVYDQIKKDLDFAAENGLAQVAGEKRSEWLTVDALNMLYARYYLDTQNYEKAAESAEEVLASDYELSSTASDMRNEYIYDNGTEAIVQLPASVSESGSGTNSCYTNFSTYTSLRQYGWPCLDVYVDPYFIPSQKLLDLYTSRDLRKTQWFSTNYYFVLLGGYFMSGVTTFTKYGGNPDLSSTYVPNARQHVKPFMIGEAYLIAAEAYYKNNDPEAAKDVLNELQAKRGAQETEVNDETLDDEWFRETVGEGLRFSCLKRWGRGFTGREIQPYVEQNGLSYTGSNYEQKSMSADDPHWVWPIPSYEIRVNSSLEHEQNPGY